MGVDDIMANTNARLIRAQKEKNDEFYTLLPDVEKELVHYGEHFKGKAVLCPCNDTEESAFWQYFHLNFGRLGLKRLTATSYGADACKIEYDGGNDSNCACCKKTRLHGNGDFRSEECLSMMEQADIIVTNPPFSLFREMISALMSLEKDFVILGNQNAVTLKDVFPYIRDRRIWIGRSIRSGGTDFRMPDARKDVDLHNGMFIQDGHPYINLSGMRWFTDIGMPWYPEHLILTEHFTPERYPEFDNYDAVNVSRTKDIPCDYDGVMGLPVTFLDKYNPEQFEILGLDRYTVPKECLTGGRLTVNGRRCYARILIRRRKPNEDSDRTSA